VLFRHDPNYRNAYSQQASLGIERELVNGLSGSVNVILVKTQGITRARDLNVLPRPIGPRGISEWTAASGCTGAALVDCFRDPALFQENIYESSGQAFYGGMTVEVIKRLHSNLDFVANYTFSRAADEVTDFNSDFQANDQTKLRFERSLSPFHQRNKLVVYAFLQSPQRWTSADFPLLRALRNVAVLPIVRANSGRPFNLLVGSDLNGDRHSTTDRPIGCGRYTGTGPNYWSVDLRVRKQLNLRREGTNLELITEGFNIFNRLNFASVNNTVGPNFVPPCGVKADRSRGPSQPLGFTSAYEARRIQLGVRLNF
jgi:hypothetical protein